jgi:hypothetical protein
VNTEFFGVAERGNEADRMPAPELFKVPPPELNQLAVA